MIFKNSTIAGRLSALNPMTIAMASVGLAALCAPTATFAQAAPASADEATDDGDIIVTARRSDEKLQDVPVSVQAVSGDTLQKLSITSADELSKIAPGLTLVNQGASTAVVLRGVAWKPGSGTAATPIYFNEAGFDPAQTVQSLFDIGQIEVLRGPQGTSRGAPSISGAITVTTKKPDLKEFGGFVQGLYGSANHFDIQAGVNVPIIKDMLAIRVATNIENSENNRVYSINNAAKPFVKDRSYRATLLFKPTDTLSIQAMYQRRMTNRLGYDQVVGSGSPGAVANPAAGIGAIPANFNGPAITSAQRASVEDGGNFAFEKTDLLTINANWEVFGQKLTYNFGRQFNRSLPSNLNARDPLNILVGYEPYATVANAGVPAYSTNEIRLSSVPNADRPFDYDIGWYSKHSGGPLSQSFTSFQPGSFGGPSALPGQPLTGYLTTPNSTYGLLISNNINLGQVFDSFYGNVNFHLDQNTELSGGLAIVRDRIPTTLDVQVGSGTSNTGLLAITLAAFSNNLSPLFIADPALRPTTCAAAGARFGRVFVSSPNYPGTCDTAVAAGTGAPPLQVNNDRYTDALYHFSLSHKFSDNVLVYATTGSSYRSGLPALGSVGLPAGLSTPRPETAISYELGIKTTFGRRLHINASVFQIDYKDQLTTFENIVYRNSVTNKDDKTSLAFYRNVDSQVRGFELEIAAQPTDNLTLGANISYSIIKAKGGLVPANNGDCAGTAATSLANPINYCTLASGTTLNQNAPFSATLNGGYTLPLGSFEGYFRFNLNYQGENPNYGNFSTAGVFKKVPSYAIVDLFAGLTGNKGGWNLGVYAKNVLDKQVELSRNTPENNLYSNFAKASGGYDVIRLSTPREIGVTLRYAFGSR
jgi:iron complex outermembrane recepter protein